STQFPHPAPRFEASASSRFAKLVPRKSRTDAHYGRAEYSDRSQLRQALEIRRTSAHRSIRDDRKDELFGPKASAGSKACTIQLTKDVDEQKANIFAVAMDEGRKLVLGIIPGILVARHLKTSDDLFDTRDSPRTRSMIAAAVQWASRLISKLMKSAAEAEQRE